MSTSKPTKNEWHFKKASLVTSFVVAALLTAEVVGSRLFFYVCIKASGCQQQFYNTYVHIYSTFQPALCDSINEQRSFRLNEWANQPAALFFVSLNDSDDD